MGRAEVLDRPRAAGRAGEGEMGGERGGAANPVEGGLSFWLLRKR